MIGYPSLNDATPTDLGFRSPASRDQSMFLQQDLLQLLVLYKQSLVLYKQLPVLYNSVCSSINSDDSRSLYQSLLSPFLHLKPFCPESDSPIDRLTQDHRNILYIGSPAEIYFTIYHQLKYTLRCIGSPTDEIYFTMYHRLATQTEYFCQNQLQTHNWSLIYRLTQDR